MAKRKMEGRRNKEDFKFSVLGASKDGIPLTERGKEQKSKKYVNR